VDTLIKEMDRVVVKTMIAGSPIISHVYRASQCNDIAHNMAFEILGVDVMIDKNWNVHVIELNASPSFATESPLDEQVKSRVLGDAFGILWKTGKKARNE